VVLPGLASGAAAQGLGEAAKREAERRAKQPAERPAKAYSGEDLANAKGGTYNQMTSPSTPGDGRDGGAAGDPGPDGPAVSTTATPSTGDPAPAGMPSGEAGWRNRMQQARDRVSRLEKEVARLDAQATASASGTTSENCYQPTVLNATTQKRLEDCMARRQTDPMRQQAKRARLMTRLAMAREDLAEAKRALTSLEEEARRSGAPPGRLR